VGALEKAFRKIHISTITQYHTKYSEEDDTELSYYEDDMGSWA
jgi:hypothetical protein